MWLLAAFRYQLVVALLGTSTAPLWGQVAVRPDTILLGTFSDLQRQYLVFDVDEASSTDSVRIDVPPAFRLIAATGDSLWQLTIRLTDPERPYVVWSPTLGASDSLRAFTPRGGWSCTYPDPHVLGGGLGGGAATGCTVDGGPFGFDTTGFGRGAGAPEPGTTSVGLFGVIEEVDSPGVLRFPAVTYADGTTMEWLGQPGSLSPAPQVLVLRSPFPAALWFVGVAGLLTLVLLMALVRRRRTAA